MLEQNDHEYYFISMGLNKTAQLKFSTDFNMMPTLNEHETFYLMLSTCMGILKFTFFRVCQTKGYLVRRQWFDVKFDVMVM